MSLRAAQSVWKSASPVTSENVKAMKPGLPHKTLTILRNASIECASSITACCPDRYEELKCNGELPSPLYSHCAPVARLVQAALGGEIVGGMVQGIQHYWNRLPNGKECDLTSCQFGGDGITPLAKGEPADAGNLTPLVALMFIGRVMRRLNC